MAPVGRQSHPDPPLWRRPADPRLGRDFFETISILHDLLNKGIGVISIEDNYVLTDSLTSKIIASGLLMAAEIQREYISRNTKAKLAAKKANGDTLGRPAGSKRISPKVIENLAAIRKYEQAGVSPLRRMIE